MASPDILPDRANSVSRCPPKRGNSSCVPAPGHTGPLINTGCAPFCTTTTIVVTTQGLPSSTRTDGNCNIFKGSLASCIFPGSRTTQLNSAKSPIVDPQDVAGKTPAEIDELARAIGLIPKGPDPQAGQGAYVDPVTGAQRILVHPDDRHGRHVNVNDPEGNRLDINGKQVPRKSPDAHILLG